MDMKNFEKELTSLINRHSIENVADMPDYLLAEMICRMIRAIGPSVKNTLDWHGCYIVCPPSPESRLEIEQIRWGESISGKTCKALRDLGWVDPNEEHESKGKLKTCIATMIVNFGPEGRCRPNLITGNESLEQMIVKVFTFYEPVRVLSRTG